MSSNPSTDATTGAAASKLSGLKAPSKLQRPSIAKPTVTATGVAAKSVEKSLDSTSNSTDTFKVGDRIWVNGTKQGTVAYIGEAKFKEGEWAGVVLDVAEGKNNGTVDGVVYFQTDENRGIFCRLNKLSKHPESSDGATTQGEQSVATATTYDMVIGERVIVNSTNGAKKGYLRYIGTTDFAKGDWAGVELDEKVGKNDGSVNGKRYFQCEALYGVFAPIAKVQKLNEEAAAKPRVNSITTTKMQAPSKLAAPKLQASKKLSGSQESLNSMKSDRMSLCSASASVKRSALATSTLQKPRLSTTAATPSTSASASTKKPPVVQPVLQQSLREKEGHINQLLKERDFERAEFTKAAQRFEQTETKLLEYTKQLQIKDEEVAKLTQTINSLSKNIDVLNEELNKNRSAVEDLEFQLEEHKLGLSKKDEDNTQHTQQHLELSDSTKSVNQNEVDELREQLNAYRAEVDQLKASEENLLNERDEIYKNLEVFEDKIRQSQIELNEGVRLREQLKENELKVDFLNEENEKLKFLCDEFEIKKSEYETKLRELDEDKQKLEHSVKHLEVKNIQVQGLYDELKHQMKLSEKELETSLTDRFNEKIENLECVINGQNARLTDVAGLEEKLKESEESVARLSQQNEEQKKANEELQQKVNDLLSNTTNSSTEFAALNEQLSAKTKLADELQTSINGLNEELKSSGVSVVSLNQQIDEQKRANEDLQQKINVLLSNSSAESTALNEQLTVKTKRSEELQASIDALNGEIGSLNEQKALVERQLSELRHETDAKHGDLEAKLRNVEEEKSKLNESLQQQLDESNRKVKSLEEKSNLLEQQLDENKKVSAELQQRISELLQNSGDNSSQLVSLNENLQQKEKQIEELQLLVNNLNQEMSNVKQESSESVTKLNGEIEGYKQQKSDVEAKLKEQESARVILVEELDTVKSDLNRQVSEARAFEEKVNELNGQLDELRKANGELQDRVGELLKASEAETSRVEALNGNVKEKEALIGELTNSLNQLKEEKLNLEQKLNEEIGLRTAKEQEIQAQAANQGEFSNEINSLKTIVEQKEAELGGKLDELNRNSAEIVKLQNEATAMKAELERLVAERQGCEARLNESQLKLHNYEEVEMKKLKLDLDALTGENQTLKTDWNVSENELKAVKELYSKIFDEKNELTNELNALKQDSSKHEQIESLTAEVNQYKQKIHDLEESLKIWESKEQHFKDIIVESDHENELKERAVKQLTSTIESLQRELEESRTAVVKSENEYFLLKEEFDKVASTPSPAVHNDDELNALRQDLLNHQALIADYEQRLSEYEAMFENAQQEQQDDESYKATETNSKAPRLFCDICDEFDLHDTEDCPQQAMQLKEQSEHQVVKTVSSRTYCDDCEEFGHDTSDDKCPRKNSNADDDQTF